MGAADALAYGVILQAVEIATAVTLGLPALVREGLTWSDMRLRALSAAPVRLSPRPGGRPRHGLRLSRAVCCSLSPMALSNISGFPRIGPQRELKFATEGYWRGEVSEAELLETARRASGSTTGGSCSRPGIDLIPSNDFSLYDHVLDTIALVGAVPERYGAVGGDRSTSTPTSRWRGAARRAAST